MKAVKRSLGILGIVALASAVGTVLVPEAAARFDVNSIAENDYLFVVPFGLAAGVVVIGALTSRTVRGVDQASPPAPEGVPTADPPGARVDRLVGSGWRAALPAFRQRDRLRGRLREAAVRTVMRRERCSRAAARQQVDSGTWTDDPLAAAFLAEAPVGRSFRTDLVALLRLELPLQRRARRTAEAIERIGRGDLT